MSETAGRICPLRYRYGPRALRQCPEQPAETLYVIGGLYGNLPALSAILTMAAREAAPVTLCFNGDFNWFNVDSSGFTEINHAVLAHDALLGNVEAELFTSGDEAGCGCAYPESVDAAVVERSNLIHARLKTTALGHPGIVERLRKLPMVRRYRVGANAVGVVHGDVESLAGWRFDVAALDDEENREWIIAALEQAQIDVFASTHTCLPVLRQFLVGGRTRTVINNGAAGMPNFLGEQSGLVTRISLHPSPNKVVYGVLTDGVHVDALAVDYEHARWQSLFLENWPEGSPAYASYFDRIVHGPRHSPRLAYPGNAPEPLMLNQSDTGRFRNVQPV